MIKIVALNGEDKDESNKEEELVATREVQETIAESEYLRAIKLKSDGEVDTCLYLLKELLQAKVLSENIKGDRNNKLSIIKYNCHKNIAVILEERFEYILSLQHYIAAILIDSTDVFTLHKFGQLALKLNAIELAEYAFENCLCRNSAHWSAAEGMLRVMNSYHNIIGLYIWANKIFYQDVNNANAKETLEEVSNLFTKNVSFFMECGGTYTIPFFSQQKNGQFCFKILFDDSRTLAKTEKSLFGHIPDLKTFVIKKQNWISVGQFIIEVYTYICNNNNQPFFFVFDFNDTVISSDVDIPDINVISNATNTNLSNIMLLKVEQNYIGALIEKPKSLITEKSDIYTLDCNNYDSDSNAKSDGFETTKPKPRRRCSDLHFLEQWGWHKSRRYSSRKKTEHDDVDSSLNGYLRKILMKYIIATIDDKWPFNEGIENSVNIKTQCEECKVNLSEDSFEYSTKVEFEICLKKLKEKRIDLMEVIYKWLKYISLTWAIPMPDNLKAVYINIFEMYISHFDLSTWNQLTPNNYEASYRICVLYLELSMENHLNNNSNLWLTVFNHLLGSIGYCYIITGKNMDIYLLRLIYLEYLLYNKRHRLEECISCLQHISDILNRMHSAFILHLPNLNNVCINRIYIQNLHYKYKRQMDINNIPKLYKEGAWDQLVNIITVNIESSKNNYDDMNWLRDICVQVKILLQSFWLMASYDNCLKWSEKCLHYATSYYLEESKSTCRSNLLAELINFVTSYIEAAILNEGFHIVAYLSKESLSRLVQNIIRILVYQFDGSFEKNSTHGQELNSKRFWVILHQLVLRQENSPSEFNTNCDGIADVSELIPNSFLILFTAHEYLGKRQWCTNDNGEFLQYILNAVVLNLKAPVYDVCRNVIYEYLEQVTYCLFKFPQKKARSRHLEDHEASQIQLCWPKAVQVFDLYRPDDLPEFNSYKLESITSDMEQLLLKIILLIPKNLDPSKSIHHVTMFIEGRCESPPTEANAFKLPFKILSLFYLLADFYFKNRDFQKAIKFYTLDLTVNPSRFDSWAGMALSKASKIETKLNGLDSISVETIWEECKEVIRCFECCINLNRFQTLLWIEYGSFSYTIHSCFSRYIKNNLNKLSAEAAFATEERKNKMLTIAFNCFSLANSLQHSTVSGSNADNADDNANDEKWLCQYMLGKISEKRKEEPKIYLNHYLLAANYLYENGATYPIKINHSNPTTLSVEALEVFYRINAAIIKYLQHNKRITRCAGDFFNKILKDLSNSPFAYNKAKIDGNSLNILKGKLIKKFKPPAHHVVKQRVQTTTFREQTFLATESLNITENKNSYNINKGNDDVVRTASQESSQNLKSIIVTGSATSSVISSDNSTVESESDSEDSIIEDENTVFANDQLFTVEELKNIYKVVVQNIEECVTRFPEHYKSIYRLVYHYMNSPEEYSDVTQSENLLLGQYKTSLGNIINGLFYDKKNNNLFNGIWRIPSSEIDRPGSFSAHLVKCVKIFIQLLHKTNNHNVLVDVAMNLYKTPDFDKRYITDTERKELCQESINCCVKILRSTLHKNYINRNDIETLNLLIAVYKIHKKFIKYMNHKEPIFAELLADIYKFFISDKVESVPENCNLLDLAVKLCVQEITSQKNGEKTYHTDVMTSTSDHSISQASSMLAIRSINIPGLSTRCKFRPNTSKNLMTSISHSYIQSSIDNSPLDIVRNQQLTSTHTCFRSGSQLAESNVPEFQNLFEEYYAKILQNEREVFSSASLSPIKASNKLENHTVSGNVSSNTVLILPGIQTTSSTIITHESPRYSNPCKEEEILSPLNSENLISTQLESYNLKSKSSHKIKTNVKPYNRLIEYKNAKESQNDVLQSNSANLLHNHEHLFFAYSDLFQNTTSTYFQTDYKKYLGATKKFKSQSMDKSTSFISNVPLPVNDLTNTTLVNDVLPLVTSSSFASLQQYTDSVNVTNSSKTLQEKLAERQKANQFNENNSKNILSKYDKSEDVIVLD